jgi:hypothetical protein
VFDASGERLDSAGPFAVAPGSALTLRHSVSDYETADDEIAAGAFVLQTTAGQLVLAPGSDDPGVGLTQHDPDGPMGSGDRLNWRFELTIGAQVDIVDGAGVVSTVPSDGLAFNITALYIDEPDGGIAAFASSPASLQVEAP